MPISDREVWTAANLIVKRHGANAEIEAARMIDRMLDRGDSEGAACMAAHSARDRGVAGASERATTLRRAGHQQRAVRAMTARWGVPPRLAPCAAPTVTGETRLALSKADGRAASKTAGGFANPA